MQATEITPHISVTTPGELSAEGIRSMVTGIAEAAKAAGMVVEVVDLSDIPDDDEEPDFDADDDHTEEETAEADYDDDFDDEEDETDDLEEEYA